MFGLALSNAETFHTLVALSQAIRDSLLQNTSVAISPQVLHHKGIALHALQQRLKSHSSVDETMMLTVLNLLALDVRAIQILFKTYRSETDWCMNSSFDLRVPLSGSICLPYGKCRHSRPLSRPSCRGKYF